MKIFSLIDKLSAFATKVKSVGTSIGNFVTGARAEGGPVSAGESYLVGEKGPELFVPRSMGSIIPNGAFAGAGVGGMTINLSITGNTLIDGNAGEKIGEQIMRTLKTNLRI